MTGSADEAVSYYRKALDVDPSYAMAYNNLGVHHLKKKDTELALKCFRQAVSV